MAFGFYNATETEDYEAETYQKQNVEGHDGGPGAGTQSGSGQATESWKHTKNDKIVFLGSYSPVGGAEVKAVDSNSSKVSYEKKSDSKFKNLTTGQKFYHKLTNKTNREESYPTFVAPSGKVTVDIEHDSDYFNNGSDFSLEQDLTLPDYDDGIGFVTISGPAGGKDFDLSEPDQVEKIDMRLFNPQNAVLYQQIDTADIQEPEQRVRNNNGVYGFDEDGDGYSDHWFKGWVQYIFATKYQFAKPNNDRILGIKDGLRRNGTNAQDALNAAKIESAKIIEDAATDAAIEGATLGVNGILNKLDDVKDLRKLKKTGDFGNAKQAKKSYSPTKLYKVEKGKNSVYRSIDAAGEVQYVGITNNLARRAAEHLRTKGIQIEKLLGGLSRSDAKAVEQVLIEIHKLGKNGGTLLNKINSISAKNPDYAKQLRRGLKLLEKIGY